ncbi:MAG: hypothetical protein C0467_17335 [Planctomycetaceae bacterium]|nr:hypothetical protein [Planctomycetaceae bacterium]
MGRSRYGVATRITFVVAVATGFRVVAFDDGIDFFLWEALGSRFQILVGLFCQPQQELDILVLHLGESRVNFLWLFGRGLAPATVADHGHADASQAVGRVTHNARVSNAEQFAHLEHGLGQPFANHLSLGLGEHAVIELAGILAELFQVAHFVFQFVGGSIPAGPLGAEFRGAGKHGLHFGGHREHGNT